MKITYSLDELNETAKWVIANAKHPILLFEGEMGSGKTTLIKAIVKQLKIDDTVSSPTFSLVNEYQSVDGKIVYHFDFYRIDSPEEALDMGVEEYLYSGNLCLIEWPNKIEKLLPLESVTISITENTNHQRTIELINNG